jgi:hypothetical protein
MDANEITCPKCGHLNNYISEGCVKCGIIFSKYFEMKDEQQDTPSAQAAADAGKENESIADESRQIVERTAPATIPFDDKAQTVAEAPAPEPEMLTPAEVKPEETQLQPAPESSIDATKTTEYTPVEKSEDMPAVAPESQAEGTQEQALEKTGYKSSSPESRTNVVPMHLEVQPEIQTTETAMTEEASSQPGVPPDSGEAAAPAAEQAEQVDPEKTETEAKPESESTTEDVKPSAQPEPAPIEALESVKETETAKNDAAPAQAKEEAKAEASVEAAPPEDEEEILLEEEAKPVKTESKTEKVDDNTRIELLKKQKAALAKAEADKKKKEEAARAVALRKQKLAKLEALKEQKAAQAKAEALKKKKAELAKAAALKKQKVASKADALKLQKASQAAVEAQTKQIQAAVKTPPATQTAAMGKGLESNSKIMTLLQKYEGKTIGINYDNSAEIKEAELVEANNEFFSVAVKDKKLQYSYPLQTLLSLVESEDGVEAEESESNTKFSAVIKVYPLVLF